MWTTEDQTVAAGHSVDDVDPVRWQALLDELLGRVAGRFARADLRRRARAFVRGLLADLPRKNCWTIAEHAGDPSPDGMQHLLGRPTPKRSGRPSLFSKRQLSVSWWVDHEGPPGL